VVTKTGARSHASQHAQGADAALYLLVAVVFFGLAVKGGVVSNVVAVLAGITILTMVVTGRLPARNEEGATRLETALAGAVLVFAVLGVTGYGSSIGPSSGLERLPGVVWAGLVVLLFMSRQRGGGRRRVVVLVALLTIAFTVLFGINAVESAREGYDVLFLHQEAADALAAGLNPYTDAVTFPNGAPTAEPGDQIVGYVYPPITAVAYAIGEWTFDDPRYTSLASWVGLLSLLSVWGVRQPTSHLPYLLLLLASLPGWPLVLRAAWTEPLSLLLLAGAAAVWRRGGASGFWLGIGLASKQYFAVAAPFLFFYRDRVWSRRALVAAIVTGLGVGVGILWGPEAFWSAAIEFHASTPPRLDSSNLVGLLGIFGLSWSPPVILPLAFGLGVAALASMRSRDVSSAFCALALALAASFFLSSQAFANYWFLVMGLCLLALATLGEESEGAQGALATAR